MLCESSLAGQPEAQDSRAELFEAIGHPTRIKILQVLHDEPRGFADLKRAVGVESSGNMSFHLTKLRDLVRTAADGNYVLTDDGREALWSVGNITGTRNIAGPGLHITRTGRTRGRILTSLLVVALLLISGAAVFQQNQIATLEAQVKSQQGQIGLYVNQAHPFTSGQGASLVLGQRDFSEFSSKPAISQSGMYNPNQVLFDSLGNLWVVDTFNNRILEFEPPFSNGMDASLAIGQKSFTTAIASTANGGFGGGIEVIGSFGPSGAAFDHSGDLWVADYGNHRVLEFKPPFATGMNASVVIGQKNFTAAIAQTSRDGLDSPTKPVFDSSDNLWVLDSKNNRVLEFEPPFSNGMNASIVIGHLNFDASQALTTQSGLNCWRGDLAIDSSGNVWVGDILNVRILEFKPPFSNGMSASFVLGQPDFTTNAVSPSLGSFLSNQPFQEHLAFGLATVFDPAGNLWTSYTGRLLEFTPPFSSAMRASLEIGQPDYTSFAWVGGQNGIPGPGIPGFDSSGNLWVPDRDNNRVLEFATASPASNSLGLHEVAQPFWQSPYIAVVPPALAISVVMALVLLRVRRKPKD